MFERISRTVRTSRVLSAAGVILGIIGIPATAYGLYEWTIASDAQSALNYDCDPTYGHPELPKCTADNTYAQDSQAGFDWLENGGVYTTLSAGMLTVAYCRGKRRQEANDTGLAPDIESEVLAGRADLIELLNKLPVVSKEPKMI